MKRLGVRWLFVGVSLLMVAAGPCWAYTPSPSETLGLQLETQLWKNLKEKNVDALAAILDDAFQSVRFDGRRDRQEEIILLKTQQIYDYELGYINVAQKGSVIVNTYVVKVSGQSVGAQTMPEEPSPRQSVWVQSKDGTWKLLGYTDLNRPKY